MFSTKDLVNLGTLAQGPFGTARPLTNTTSKKPDPRLIGRYDTL